MYDFSKQVRKFHKTHVRLTDAQRSDMRNRRQTNLDRIAAGLAELGKPAFVETINQGGYAQKTMTQPPEADEESRYDIDLGVVFNEDDTVGPRITRGWVRDAIARKATNMKHDPESKKNCVRVIYAAGYQCDFPVLRRHWDDAAGWLYELASGDDWIASDPRSMNAWVDEQVLAKSPETSGSRQLRRIIRLGKFFAKTHANRRNRKFPGGLVATALFVDAFVSREGRDDEAFGETLRAISYRSKHNLVYANGVQISGEKDVDRIGRLIEEAKAAIEELDKLSSSDTTESDARAAWKTVFRHSFFDEEETKAAAEGVYGALETKGALTGAVIAAPFIASKAAAALSNDERMERVESAVRARNENGGGGKPWAP